MKSFLKTTSLLLFAALVTFSCESSYDSLVDERLEENPAPDSVSGSSGSADFSNYVAIGNSLTAGFMDAALYNEGQENSIPALLAEQLEFAGAPATFNQPDIDSELGFNKSESLAPNPQNLGRFKLNTRDTTIGPIGPLPTSGGDPIGDYSGSASDLNNFGVPQIILRQLTEPATGGPDSDQNPLFNRYYQRFASSPGSSTILEDAISANPSFFTLWIGSNDILRHALKGAPNPSLLTPRNVFSNQYYNGTDGVVDQLLANTDANGVLINIPNVLAVPYFQVVQWNAVSFDTSDPEDQETVKTLKQNFDQYNQALDQFESQGAITEAEATRRKVKYADGSNPVLINDETLTNLCNFDPNIAPYCIARPATENDLFPLSAKSVIGTLADPNNPQSVRGVAVPLEDQYALIPSEITEILTQVARFNGVIEAAANSSDRLALYDTRAANSAFTDIFGLAPNDDPGITVDGVDLAADFRPDGVFSLDFIHPNPRGNAIVANEIIGVIEDNFGASIPEVNVLNLPSVQLCEEEGDCVNPQSKMMPAMGNISYDTDMTR